MIVDRVAAEKRWRTCSSSSEDESLLESLDSTFLPLALAAGFSSSSSSEDESESESESDESLEDASAAFFAASSSSRFLRSASSAAAFFAASSSAFFAAFRAFLSAFLSTLSALTGVAVAAVETDDLVFLSLLAGLVEVDLPMMMDCKRVFRDPTSSRTKRERMRREGGES